MQLVKPMRRTIALSLLMIFGWSLMAPLFAPMPRQIFLLAAGEIASIIA